MEKFFPTINNIMQLSKIAIPQITPRQRQVIIGTILGGSSIVKPKNGKNCYLSMRGKNTNWLEWKAFQLDALSSYEPFTIEKTNRWHSFCLPAFNEFKEKYYNNNNRSLKLKELELLWDIALATWYGDSGKIVNDLVVLNTNIWGDSGTKIFVKYFKLIDYNAAPFTERGHYIIQLDEESSFKFLKLVGPQLPEFMK
jgi:hypothetical protein